jgi:hypothetical protein
MGINELFDPSRVHLLQSRLDDLERLPLRIEEIRTTLREAGIET